MQISVISKDRELFDILCQHDVLNGEVRFAAYDDIAGYEAANVASSVVVMANDVAGKIANQAELIQIGKDLSTPFHLQELFSLLQKMLDKEKDVKIGKYQFNYVHKTLQSAKELVSLTDKEAEIVSVLLEVYPSSMDKKDLLHNVWGYSEEVDSHTLETHIYRLRKKINSPAGSIITDSEGYKLSLD